MAKLSYLEAIRQAQDLALQQNKDVFILVKMLVEKVAYLVLLKDCNKNMVKTELSIRH